MHKAPFVQAAGPCTHHFSHWSCVSLCSPSIHTKPSSLPPPPDCQARKIGDHCTISFHAILFLQTNFLFTIYLYQFVYLFFKFNMSLSLKIASSRFMFLVIFFLLACSLFNRYRVLNELIIVTFKISKFPAYLRKAQKTCHFSVEMKNLKIFSNILKCLIHLCFVDF